MHGTLKVKILKSLKNVDWVVNWGPMITPVVLSSSIFLHLPRKLFILVEKRMLFSRTNCWRSSRLHVYQSTIKNSISAPYGWNVTQIN